MTAPVEDNDESHTVIKVQIVSNGEKYVMKVPVSSLLEREAEMESAALEFSIDPTSWDGSRLYRLYQNEGRLTIVLYPDDDGVTHSYSHRLKWAEWLTTLMQGYYNNGEIDIPDDCQGYDLLLALEFFGILYQPDQLQFGSYSVYSRVKHWSEYYTNRATMGDWISEYVLQNGSVAFATASSPNEKLTLDGEQVISWMSVDPTIMEHASMTSAGTIVFDFFNSSSFTEDDESSRDRAQAVVMMRQDFADYLQHLLTDINVVFKLMTVGTRKGEEKRAVLKITVKEEGGSPSRVKRDELSTNVDDLIQEEIHNRKMSNMSSARKSPQGVDAFPFLEDEEGTNVSEQKIHDDVFGKEERPLGRSPRRSFDNQSPNPNAPVRLIQTRGDHSITSALTGPFADYDNDTIETDPLLDSVEEVQEEEEEAAVAAAAALPPQQPILEEKEEDIVEELKVEEQYTEEEKSMSDRVGEFLQNARSHVPLGSLPSPPRKFSSLQESIEWFSSLQLCRHPYDDDTKTVPRCAHPEFVSDDHSRHSAPAGSLSSLRNKLTKKPLQMPVDEIADECGFEVTHTETQRFVQKKRVENEEGKEEHEARHSPAASPSSSSQRRRQPKSPFSTSSNPSTMKEALSKTSMMSSTASMSRFLEEHTVPTVDDSELSRLSADNHSSAKTKGVPVMKPKQRPKSLEPPAKQKKGKIGKAIKSMFRRKKEVEA